MIEYVKCYVCDAAIRVMDVGTLDISLPSEKRYCCEDCAVSAVRMSEVAI